MPENEFEKQVQQKMSELQFVPSAAAWEKIEKQVADKKRRRRIALWLPLLFLFFGAGGWYYTMQHKAGGTNSRPAVKTTAPETKQENANIKTENKNIHAPEVVAGDRLLEKSITDKSSRSAPRKKDSPASAFNRVTPSTENNSANTKALTGQKNKATATTRREPVVFQTKHKAGVNKGQAKENTREGSMTEDKGSALTGAKRRDRNETILRKPANETTDSSQASLLNQPLVVIKQAASDSSKTLPVKDSVAAVAKSKPARAIMHKEIEWGLNVVAGSSQISPGFPGLTFTRDALAYSSVPQSNGSNASGNIAYTSPSAVASHFSWSAGVVLKKPIGRTWKLNTGLNYHSYATGIELGPKIGDSAVYRNGRTASYTNHVHFIEVPVSIEKQLGVHSRFSLSGGLAFSALVASNQVRFDQQTNLYYADKNIVNKTQWSLVLGLNYRLLQKKIHLETGPVINYQLGNAFNKDVYGNGHWFFAGMGATLFFDKRKK
jgi:hypothetical protein